MNHLKSSRDAKCIKYSTFLLLCHTVRNNIQKQIHRLIIKNSKTNNISILPLRTGMNMMYNTTTIDNISYHTAWERGLKFKDV